VINGSVAVKIGYYHFISLWYIIDERCGTIPDLHGCESIAYLNCFGAKDAFKFSTISNVTLIDILFLTH